MGGPNRPHVSAALQHLRRSIFVVAAVLGLALLANMLIWSFAHFTEAHQQQLTPAFENAAVVAAAADKVEATELRAPAQGPRRLNDAGVIAPAGSLVGTSVKAAPGLPFAAVDAAAPNVVGTGAKLTLERVSAIVQTVGVLSALLLAVLMLQAVVVAGGAGVPGVEKAVTASTWALLLALVVLPIQSVMPAAPWPGVFGSYEQMLASSTAFAAGGEATPGFFGFYGYYLVLPVLLLAGLAALVLRFNAGVEAGVIVMHASQLDEKLEREIRGMKLGELSQPRAVGALQRAMGDDGESDSIRRGMSEPAEGSRPSRII